MAANRNNQTTKVIHYDSHIFQLRDLNGYGRGGHWVCKKSRIKKGNVSFCPVERITIIDGKLYDKKNQKHNHESEPRLMLKQKLCTQLISVVKQRKKENPFANIDLKQEYNTLKKCLDPEKWEIMPNFQETQYYLHKLVKNFHPYMEKELFAEKNSIIVSIHIKFGLQI